MARRQQNKPSRAEREARRQRRDQDQLAEMVADIASKYSCSTEIARDFAEQCENRIDDLDFDLACSNLALDFWAGSYDRAQPVIDVLRALAVERRRHADAIADLHRRLVELTKVEAVHQHLELPASHYETEVRRRLFPEPAPRPVQNYATSGDR